MDEVEIDEGKSLAITPTWALATVVTVMVCFGFFFQVLLDQFGKVKNRKEISFHLYLCGFCSDSNSFFQ